MTIPESWRTAEASANNTNCVKVRNDLGAFGDSKNPDATAILELSREAVTALIQAVR